ADPQLAGIPVIFYSATYSLGQAQAMARDRAVFGVLPKPSEPEVILRLVNRALSLPPWKSTSLPAAETPGETQFPSMTSRPPEDPVALEAVSSRLAALIEMSLDLATERNPEQLLQGFGHMARKLIPSKYGVVGILGDDGRTLKRILFSGIETAPTLPAALPPSGPLEKMLTERRPLLLRGLTSERLGLPFPVQTLSSL